MFLLSFGNPALIILFPQSKAWWLPVAYGLTKIREDIKEPPTSSSLCSSMKIEQIVSYLEEVDVRNLRQQANLKWVRRQKCSLNPLVRFFIEEPGKKAADCLWATELDRISPRNFLPEHRLLKRSCDCLGPPWKTSAASRLAPSNSSESKPS